MFHQHHMPAALQVAGATFILTARESPEFKGRVLVVCVQLVYKGAFQKFLLTGMICITTEILPKLN